MSCHALGVPDCIKILIPVVESNKGGSRFSVPKEWASSGANHLVIPVLLPGISPDYLNKRLKPLNAIVWNSGDQLAVSRLLSAGGVGSARPRLFISYVRRDSESIAEQLFDGLHQEGFEVFLDRFSIKPGADFQIKLAEELCNMGTVLVIESRNILNSPWVLFEVNFARSHRLGLVALKLPRGKPVPGINELDRKTIGRFKLNIVQNRLRKSALQKVLPWIKNMHMDAEDRRRSYLRDTMTDSLLLSGIWRQRLEPDEILLAENNRGERFAFQISNLPPELKDFHTVAPHRSRTHQCFVLGPAKYMGWRKRAPLDWLANDTKINLEDESEIANLARRLS